MDKTDGWDGTFRSGEVQFDSYTYQMVVTYYGGRTENMAGTVIVMR